VNRRGGKGIAAQVDHAKDEEVAALFDQVRREQQRLDILVNNAFSLPEDLTQPQKSGLIVATSGYVGVTYTYGVVFGTCKSAVDRMARDMAIDLKPHSVASISMWLGLTFTERAERDLARNPAMQSQTVTNPIIGSSVEFPGRVIAALAGERHRMVRLGPHAAHSVRRGTGHQHQWGCGARQRGYFLSPAAHQQEGVEWGSEALTPG
jgi:NAD(P)-dependent dehydrogenase (short-subunit alcohol dehydrogenase family)